jgi:hypothetical protein
VGVVDSLRKQRLSISRNQREEEQRHSSHLDERLDLRSPGDSLGTHRLGNLQRVPIPPHPISLLSYPSHLTPLARLDSLLDSGNNGVGVRPVLGTLVNLLDDDDLLSSLTSREDDSDLAGLVD